MPHLQTAQKNLPFSQLTSLPPFHCSLAESPRVNKRKLNSNLSVLFLVSKSDKNLKNYKRKNIVFNYIWIILKTFYRWGKLTPSKKIEVIKDLALLFNLYFINTNYPKISFFKKTLLWCYLCKGGKYEIHLECVYIYI